MTEFISKVKNILLRLNNIRITIFWLLDTPIYSSPAAASVLHVCIYFVYAGKICEEAVRMHSWIVTAIFWLGFLPIFYIFFIYYFDTKL